MRTQEGDTAGDRLHRPHMGLNGEELALIADQERYRYGGDEGESLLILASVVAFLALTAVAVVVWTNPTEFGL